jgi:MFS family permease
MTGGGGRAAAPVRRRLWSDRDFTIFWCGQTLSELGNSFALVALPLLVLATTGSIVQMGLLTAVSTVSSIATGLFVGGFVDRWDRRRLMIACDLARIALFGAIPVCWAIGPQLWLLYVVMALASVFNMTFKVTYVTAVPNLVDHENIVAANGRLETTNAIAYIVGPSLAGLVSGWLGPTVAVAVNAASFAASAVALALIRFRRRPVDPQPEEGRVWQGFLTGFHFLWRTPVLRALTILLTVVTFLSLGITDVVIFQLRHGLGQDQSVVGVVLGVAGIGTVLAAMLTPLLRRSLGFGVCWLGSYVVCGVAVALIGMSSQATVIAVLVLCHSFGMSVAGISSVSLRQVVTPDRLLGRVTSAFWTTHTALAPVGAAVLTGLVGRFGVQAPMIGAGVVFGVVVVVGSFTAIRQRHPETAREAVNVGV